eukprot:m.14784 g.14784  ORF g.14784 m.14784 type:complete len:331 (+) comp6507_c0_seq1:72-1064(+)
MAARWVLLALLVCGSAQKLPQLNINKKQISVSGVSSGGAMATQVHVAHSSVIMGVGIFAGPPYWCAQANVEIALSACTSDPNLISIQELVDATDYALALDSIDSTKNLASGRVWIFSGRLDTIVKQGVVNKTREYYRRWVPDSNIKSIDWLPSQHAWVTKAYGNNCSYLGSPYINNCNFDAAGDMLQFIYSNLIQPTKNANNGSLAIYDQKYYTPEATFPHEISLGDVGYIYVPSTCQSGTECRLHVAFHGCNQDLETVGETFVRNSGLNEWAEANNIVVLYPQTRKSPDVPYNPQGCWDWWGYTGLDYAVRISPQILTVRNMIDAVTGS